MKHTENSKSAITSEEIERRRKALRQADANNRLEGIFRDPESDAIFETHIRGEIDSQELTERLKIRTNNAGQKSK